MSGLLWVRLDVGWYMNPKFLTLLDDDRTRAVVLYMGGLAYAGHQGTDGYVPALALPMLSATVADAEDLVEVTLWQPADRGWQINDWADYQISNDETRARSQRARDAARKRWGH